MATYGVEKSGMFDSLAELTGSGLVLFENQDNRQRLNGLQALESNIYACLSVCDTLKTSFGPKGMDKIIVCSTGEVCITNDGATILRKMPLEHECAKILLELSQSQDDQIGDGTTGIVIFAGALLKASLNLLNQNIHPLHIASAYEDACAIAVQTVQRLSKPIDFGNREHLIKAAHTALCSKTVEAEHEKLSKICVDAVLAVADLERKDVPLDLISVEGKAGGSLSDSFLVNGIALEKEFSHYQMPPEVYDAKIAILACPFEPPKPKTKHKLEIRDKETYRSLVDQEIKYFESMIAAVKNAGANVVICQWGFDDEANHLLLRNGINAIRWVSGKEIEYLSLSTGGCIISRFEDLSPSKLGYAKSVRQISVGAESKSMIVIEVPESRKAVSIIVRGGNAMLIAEAQRSIHDALCAVRNLLVYPNIVCGAGAIEVAANFAVLEASTRQTGYRQLVFEAFADALLELPTVLANNSGFNGDELVVALRAAQKRFDRPDIGLDCDNGVVMDKENNVYESALSKKHQFELAVQVTKMILRIDDIIEEVDDNSLQNVQPTSMKYT